jgi:hypothetical protein
MVRLVTYSAFGLLLLVACAASPDDSARISSQHDDATLSRDNSALRSAPKPADRRLKGPKLPPLREESEVSAMVQFVQSFGEQAWINRLLGPTLDAPPAPTVRPFGDNKFWVTLEPIQYEVGSTSDQIVIPAGFVTDFASIPQPLWSLGLSPHGQYSRAALIHDFLYWTQPCIREQADRLLVIAMKESMVSPFDEFLIYQGVNLGGSAPWSENAAERLKKLPRFIPREYLRPTDPNMKWPKYREYLVSQGVQDPPIEEESSYCRHGNSTTVP